MNSTSTTPHLRTSKVRHTELPVEYRMMHLIKDIENPHKSWSEDTHLCNWSGVSCNRTALPLISITEILWRGRNLAGRLRWEFLPPTVRNLDVGLNTYFGWQQNMLKGPLPLYDMPTQLKKILVGYNQLSGELALTSLPSNLWMLNVSSNDFEGNVDLTALPRTLEFLQMDTNPGLRGPTDLSCLPLSLCSLTMIQTGLYPSDTQHVPRFVKWSNKTAYAR